MIESVRWCGNVWSQKETVAALASVMDIADVEYSRLLTGSPMYDAHATADVSALLWCGVGKLGRPTCVACACPWYVHAHR